MFDYFGGRERNVRRALRAIAGQRVVGVIAPHNVMIIERSPTHDESFDIGVRTALIRGWVEVLYDTMPSAQVKFSGNQMAVPDQLTPKTHYRLTEGGWSAIHGTHAWTVATFTVSFFALLASLVAVAVAWP